MTRANSSSAGTYEVNGYVTARRDEKGSKFGVTDLLFRGSRTDRLCKRQLQHLEQRCAPYYERTAETSADVAFCDDPDDAIGWAAQMLVRSNRANPSNERQIRGLERRSGLVFGCKKALGQIRDVFVHRRSSRVVPCDTVVEAHADQGDTYPNSASQTKLCKHVTFVDTRTEQVMESVLTMPNIVPDSNVPVDESVCAENDKINMSTASTACSDQSSAVEFSPSRPVFARTSRETKITQIAKLIDEFCLLQFDAVAAEDQAALVARMLTTLKSLASHDFFWADGKKQREFRFVLLGLEEEDMIALGQFAQTADGLSDSRCIRQAYDELCKARQWLQADKAGLESLRKEWKESNESHAKDLNDSDPDAYKFLPGPIATASGVEFTLVSFNILAGELGRPKTHGYCDADHLSWERRREKMLEGFRRALPDLLLMQEVQGTTQPHKTDHFSDLKEALSQDGYEVGSYARLTASNGVELGTEQGSKSKKKPHIGNAIFFRSSVWQRLSEGRIAFAQLLKERCSGNEPQCKHYAEGKQVAAWARLLHVATQRTVVVVSVHIGANWRNPDTQVAQVEVMLKDLDRIVQEGDSVVIGGDFNSMPSSGVYSLLHSGHLPADHEDCCPKDDKVPKLCDRNGFISPLSLSSAYAVSCKNEPEFTTVCGASPGTPEASSFSGTLDYIWYSPQTLVLVPESALRMPTFEEASRENGGLPNSIIPSDHVPIGVAMSFASS